MNGILENHLHSIEDYVMVEDKIVTYKWISKVLKVHINTAKQLLHVFACKEEFYKKLFVTYLIAGEGKDESGFKFFLVNKDDVEKVKQSLDKLVCEHVYSVQRNTKVDPKDLYNADCTYELNEEDRKLCSIQKNDDIVKRCKPIQNSTTVELSKNKNSTEKSSAKNAVKKDSLKTDETNNVKQFSQTKPDSNKAAPENNVTLKEQNSPTKETKTSPSKVVTSKNKKLKTAPSKGPSIGTFFSKQAALANTKKSLLEHPDKEKEEIKENLEEIIQGTPENDNQIHIKDVKKEIKPTNNKTPQSKRKENPKKRKKRDKDHESAKKRRKRIVIASDSESSGSEMDFEEEREPSPEPEPVPVPQESEDEIIPATPVQKGRKRVRKLIDRTFSEDGFLVTKKEFVYESCSDNEDTSNEVKKETIEDKKKSEESSSKKEPNKIEENNDIKLENDNHKIESKKSKTTKKKTSPKKSPAKSKQRTIMNFFQKK